MPLLTGPRILVVVADGLIDVIAYIGMAIEELTNSRPLIHFTRVANDIGISAELAGKILVLISLEKTLPVPGRPLVIV